MNPQPRSLASHKPQAALCTAAYLHTCSPVVSFSHGFQSCRHQYPAPEHSALKMRFPVYLVLGANLGGHMCLWNAAFDELWQMRAVGPTTPLTENITAPHLPRGGLTARPPPGSHGARSGFLKRHILPHRGRRWRVSHVHHQSGAQASLRAAGALLGQACWFVPRRPHFPRMRQGSLTLPSHSPVCFCEVSRSLARFSLE